MQNRDLRRRVKNFKAQFPDMNRYARAALAELVRQERRLQKFTPMVEAFGRSFAEAYDQQLHKAIKNL